MPFADMYLGRLVLTLVLAVLPTDAVRAQEGVRLAEVMSANATTLGDADGDRPDWIELHNAGPDTVELAGYGLSDDAERPFRWTLPAVRLAPNERLLVMASGKDRARVVDHYETVVDWGDAWRYLVPRETVSSAWRQPGFDEAGWPEGPSGFGYGDGDDATDVGPDDPFAAKPASVFARTTFTVDDTAAVMGLLLHVDYDDGFVAYLNGTEVARANVGTPGTPPSFDTYTPDDHEARLYEGGAPEAFRLHDAVTLLRPGANVLAVQVHNVQEFSSDMTLIPFLTLEMDAAPTDPRGPSPHLSLGQRQELHASFSLSAAGETVQLTAPHGTVADRVEVPELPADVSYGRQASDGAWVFFAGPTPGTPNPLTGATGQAEAPAIFPESGRFQHALTAAAAAADGLAIHYTTDGSLPTPADPRYEVPLRFDATTVLRARTFGQGQQLLPGPTVTRTYLVDEDLSLPVVALTAEPEHFFDHETGIYVMGPDAENAYPHFGANFWKDWERPVHLELIEPDGTLGFAADVGVKIFGSWSRLFPQKSLSVFARGRYGPSSIDYPLFPNRPFEEYQAFVLRNSGQDWTRTLFRDAMQHRILQPTGLDVQAYRPAFVFINGRPWGIHNLREKMNEHYLAAHHGVDPDAIDLIERDEAVVHGDDAHYRALIDYATSHDLGDAQHYAHVGTRMDVDNFIEYTVALLYVANPDWPWNNVKAWRPRTDDGRWRWMVYDLDYAFHRSGLGPETNTFDRMRSDQNRGTGVSRLFFALLENASFRHAFANRFADRLNTTFAAHKVTSLIDTLAATLAFDVPRHIDRWRGTFSGPSWLGETMTSTLQWRSHVQVARTFGRQRPAFMREHVRQELGLADTAHVEIRAWPDAASGRVRINSVVPERLPWSGTYFTDVPVTLTAIPSPGYRFEQWNGIDADTPTASVSLTDGRRVMAVFARDTTAAPVAINEINYHSADDFDPEDWVELHNPADEAVDVSGWVLKDGDDTHAFALPAGTTLDARSFLVLCRDTSAFGQHFPGTSCHGDFDFGFTSDGEAVRLYDASGMLVDSVAFRPEAPWPTAPDGQEATLALRDPRSDNTQPENWGASEGHGTPGGVNRVAVAAEPPTPLPDAYRLLPSYPAPARGSTTIPFVLPERAHVTLDVFDVTGRRVARLAEGTTAPGRHRVTLDTSTLPAGVYAYRLTAGPFTRSRMLVVVR